jgi:hypothetical protein
MAGRSSEFLWLIFLLGWSGAEASWDWFRRVEPAPGPAVEGTPDPREAPPRELRRLPGLGETRALAVVRARWWHPADGPPLYLSDVPGVGSATERAVREWMEGARGP